MAEKKNESTKEKICIGVYITCDMHAKLTSIAADKELKLSDVVRAALREYAEKEKKVANFATFFFHILFGINKPSPQAST